MDLGIRLAVSFWLALGAIASFALFHTTRMGMGGCASAVWQIRQLPDGDWIVWFVGAPFSGGSRALYFYAVGLFDVAVDFGYRHHRHVDDLRRAHRYRCVEAVFSRLDVSGYSAFARGSHPVGASGAGSLVNGDFPDQQVITCAGVVFQPHAQSGR